MGYIAYFQHGDNKFYVDGRDALALALGWGPPAPAPNTILSSGTMANQYSGGKRLYRQFSDRPMGIPINDSGDSYEETHREITRLASFFEIATADTSKIFYFVYHENNDIPHAPKWGQSYKFYEIKDADLAITRLRDYSTAGIREKFIAINLPILVAPTTTGLRQCVGSATGGIQEHSYATRDKLSRGTFIPRAVTNLHTNPVFGHGTYDTGWSVGASTVKSENKDCTFIFYGEASCKVTNQDTAAAHSLYQTITLPATTHIESLYVKLPDGGTIDSAVARVFYDGAPVDSDYWHIGNGWYRVSAQITGTAAATSLGLWINAAYTLYLGGAQCEGNTTYPTPLAVGDMLDQAWSGTAHNSTSTRPAGRLRYPFANLIEEGGFSIYVCVMPYHNHDDSPTTLRIFRDSDSDIALLYDIASTSWRFTDGTTVVSYTDTFNAGDVRHIHMVCTPADGIAIYVNGDTDGNSTNSTFTPSTAATYLYIGSTAVPDEHANCTYLDMITWREGLTAAEVLAHYNNKNSAASDADGVGARLGCLPWLWTDDGDDTVDNCDDSTRENWFVSGGVPGNLPANTFVKIDPMAGAAFGETIWISNHLDNSSDWLKPAERFYIEGSGTAEAGTSGGEYKSVSLPNSPPYPNDALTVSHPGTIRGPIHFLARMRSTTGAISVDMGYYVTFNGGIFSDQKTVSVDTTYRYYYLGALDFDPDNLTEILDTDELEIKFNVNFGSSDTDTLRFDFCQIINGDISEIPLYETNIPGGGGAAVSPDWVKINKRTAILDNSTSSSAVERNEFELVPNFINTIICALANDGGAHVITDTIEFEELEIIPRWSLI